MAESQQHKLDRVRPPRVQITYDVETNGAMEKRELPFLVGVMAELSGHRPQDEIGPIKGRDFKEIDRDNIDAVMKDAAPVLNLSVANKLTDDNSNLRVALKFEGMEDFSPYKVADQIAPLKELLEMRKRLDEVLSKISTNEQLAEVLQDVINNTEQVQKLAKELGTETPAKEGA